MPSRKRNKGKERKNKKHAAKAASHRAFWAGWAHGETLAVMGRMGIGEIAAGPGCNHGCAVLPPPDHAAAEFMNTFVEALQDRYNDVWAALKITFEKHREVWYDAGHRRNAIGILLSWEQIYFCVD